MGAVKFLKDVNNIKERIISKNKGLVLQYSVHDSQGLEEDVKMLTLSPRRGSQFEIESRPYRL